MNTLLINVSVRPDSPLIQFPIGLAFIATAMRNAGIEFNLLNIDGERLSDREIEEFLGRRSFDVICLGTMVTGYSKVKALTAKLRALQPQATIVVGNSVATSVPHILLTRTEADVAVMGEGDVTVVELLRALESGRPLDEVAGICFLRDGSLVRTPSRPAIKDISALPMIDYSLWDMDIYITNSPLWVHEPCPIPREQVRGMQVNTARGCIANCTFCYHNFQGAPYRHRSNQVILDEIQWLIDNHQLNFIMFWDDLTFYSKKQAGEFAADILARGLGLHWIAHCRADLFDQEADRQTIALMKQAGCYAMNFSLESANPEILKAMNKRLDPEQFSRQVGLFRQEGVQVYTSLVFGYPQETPETIRQTIDCCIANRIYPSSGFYLPQPGSAMYEQVRAQGLIPDEEEFLMLMGDRQDFRFNLTSMPDEVFKSLVLEGLKRCSEELKIGLAGEQLLKTTTYRPAQDA